MFSAGAAARLLGVTLRSLCAFLRAGLCPSVVGLGFAPCNPLCSLWALRLKVFKNNHREHGEH